MSRRKPVKTALIVKAYEPIRDDLEHPKRLTSTPTQSIDIDAL
jgi:hypothetical protein